MKYLDLIEKTSDRAQSDISLYREMKEAIKALSDICPTDYERKKRKVRPETIDLVTKLKINNKDDIKIWIQVWKRVFQDMEGAE